ncbi:MAG: hypothetical protein J3K34DRAFT_430593, partial [Monoraphidium minutum]
AAAADAAGRAAAAQQWRDDTGAALGALRAELEAARVGLADAREGAARAQEELRGWVAQQLQAHRAAVDEAVQSVSREARAESGTARAEVAAASAAGLRQLEAWVRGEMLAVTGKLKHVVASCAAQQEQVRGGRRGRCALAHGVRRPARLHAALRPRSAAQLHRA